MFAYMRTFVKHHVELAHNKRLHKDRSQDYGFTALRLPGGLAVRTASPSHRPQIMPEDGGRIGKNK